MGVILDEKSGVVSWSGMVSHIPSFSSSCK